MILLVSGIPAAGKSSYCGWLEQEKKYIHFDIDRRQFQGTGVQPQWDAIFRPNGSVEPFVKSLSQWRRSAIIDWGFPPAWLQVVRDFKDVGVDIWWFDADISAARQKFIERAEHSVENFDRQIARIQQAWPMIAAVFGSHLMRTLCANGIYLSGAEIFRRMFGRPF